METKICKVCAKCGLEWTEIPEKAKLFLSGDAFEGYYWECQCNTSLFIPMEWLKKEAA